MVLKGLDATPIIRYQHAGGSAYPENMRRWSDVSCLLGNAGKSGSRGEMSELVFDYGQWCVVVTVNHADDNSVT